MDAWGGEMLDDGDSSRRLLQESRFTFMLLGFMRAYLNRIVAVLPGRSVDFSPQQGRADRGLQNLPAQQTLGRCCGLRSALRPLTVALRCACLIILAAAMVAPA